MDDDYQKRMALAIAIELFTSPLRLCGVTLALRNHLGETIHEFDIDEAAERIRDALEPD